MRKRNREFLAVFLVIVLVVMAFSPTALNNMAVYNYIKYVVFGLLVFLTFSTGCIKALRCPFIFRFFVITTLTGIMLFSFYSFGFSIRWSDLVSLIVVAWITSIGYCSFFDDKDFESLVLVFSIVSVLVGVYSMIYYVGAVTLADYMYAVDTKNMIGQLVATSGIGVSVSFLSSTRYKWVKITLIVITTVLMFVLRCKTALVAFLLFGIFFIRKAIKSRTLVLLYILGTFVIVVFYSRIVSFLDVVFVGSKDIMDLNDISSGRLQRNVDGLLFLYSNPIFGELKTVSGVENIHNYVLKRLVAYGIFSLPFIILYFYCFVKCIKEWFGIGKNIKEIRNLGSLMLIIPFFSSLLEPSAPFGPGLLQLIPFFFYGAYLKSTRDTLKPANKKYLRR